MNKIDMREWIASLEEVIDNKLSKWLKHNKIENGAAVNLGWQFELTHIQMDIFWQDHQETVKLRYLSPRIDECFLWHGLNDRTFDEIIGRVGALDEMTMFPPNRLYGLNG
jgi:hypothetical protein